VKELWQCPRCGRRFASRNQTHTCALLGRVSEHLAGKSASVIAIYEALVAAIECCGPVIINPTKTRIAFQVRMNFAAVKLRQNWVDGHVILARRLESPRFTKVITYSAHNHEHDFRLTSADEVDDELREWLCEAYTVGAQQHLARKPVEIIDGLVRRPLAAWTPAVHGLLRHLESIGFEGVPRAVAVEEDRDVVTFVPGEVGHYPLNARQWSDGAMLDAARWLRRFHDATASYRPFVGPWRFVYPDPSQHEVICHNDYAPYNMTFVEDRPVGLIDFDTACPGPRIWDVAYAAYRFVPLVDHAYAREIGMMHPDPARRLALFCEAYGLENPDEVITTAARRLEALCEHMEREAAAGNFVHRSNIAAGHLDLYRGHIQLLRSEAFRS